MSRIICGIALLLACAGCATTPSASPPAAVKAADGMSQGALLGSLQHGAVAQEVPCTIVYGNDNPAPTVLKAIEAGTKGKFLVWGSSKLTLSVFGGFFSWSSKDKAKFVMASVRKYQLKDFGDAAEEQIKQVVGVYKSEKLGLDIVMFEDGAKRRAVLREEFEVKK